MKNSHSQSLPRFLVVGGANTALDFGLLFILNHLGLPALIANIISTGCAFIFSFFANKKYTFSGGSDNIRREMVLFVVVTLFGLWAIQTCIIAAAKPILVPILGSSESALFVAKLIATVASMTWNYVLYIKLVFVKH